MEREFVALLASGAPLHVAGSARGRPEKLLAGGYLPRHRLQWFDTTYYLGHPRQNPLLRFFVAYVVTTQAATGRREAHARLFYKDVSLLWRVATHYTRTDDDFWLGKGDVCSYRQGGQVFVSSDEATTDLPLELQAAVDTLAHASGRARRDEAAVDLVLRRAPEHRIAPYRDFSAPRAEARRRRSALPNGGRQVARFLRRDDPTSLVFVPGFEPDFARGLVDRSETASRLFGGRVQRFRFLSCNRTIQYLVFAAPRHVWLAPPQTTGHEVTSYGVRPLVVPVDEYLCIPGFEYHFEDDEAGQAVLHSQIPHGHVGAASEVHESLVDASPWIERMPVVQEFRRWWRRGRTRPRGDAPRRAGRDR